MIGKATCSADIFFPELVYKEVENVAKKIFTIKKAKTKIGFERALRNYTKSLEEANDRVAIVGYQIIEKTWIFQEGKVLTTN